MEWLILHECEKNIMSMSSRHMSSLGMTCLGPQGGRAGRIWMQSQLSRWEQGVSLFHPLIFSVSPLFIIHNNWITKRLYQHIDCIWSTYNWRKQVYAQVCIYQNGYAYIYIYMLYYCIILYYIYTILYLYHIILYLHAMFMHLDTSQIILYLPPGNLCIHFLFKWVINHLLWIVQ